MMDEKNKTAIVLVSFGTTNAAARANSLDAVEHDTAAAFPDIEVCHACTSPTVRRVMCERDGIRTESFSEALDRLAADGFRRVICQPTYVMNGYEYDDMLTAAQKYRGSFDDLLCGSPLITPDSGGELIDALEQAVGFDEDMAYVLVGHGTSHPSNRVYTCLGERFRDRGYRNVFVGTIESTPGIDDIMLSLKECGKHRAVLIPLLTVSGVHASEDIFGEETSWMSAMRDAGYDVVCLKRGLCEYPEVRKLIVNSIRCRLNK